MHNLKEYYLVEVVEACLSDFGENAAATIRDPKWALVTNIRCLQKWMKVGLVELRRQAESGNVFSRFLFHASVSLMVQEVAEQQHLVLCHFPTVD